MLLQYNAKYKVLICQVHKCAINNPTQHLRYEHFLDGKDAEALIHDFSKLDLCDARHRRTPPDGQEERSWLAAPVDGFSCTGTGCRFNATNYSNLLEHWLHHHRLNLHDAPAPTFDAPKSYARCVRLQSLYNPPIYNYDWFTVVPAAQLSMLNDFILQMRIHQDKQKRKTQSALAIQRHDHNENHSFLHKLPPEVRNQIYNHVLTDGIGYHIEDMLAPVTPDCKHQNQGSYNDDDHIECRCSVEADIKNFYQQNGSSKLRAISLSSSSGNPVSLLQTCRLTNREASPIFYSRNRFFIHTRWGNWTSVNQFLNLLRPHIRHCIRNLGVVPLRPSSKPAVGPDAFLYYPSMKTFLTEFLPQLSLQQLTLCVDLFGDYPASHRGINVTPLAPWLNPFLRLHETTKIEIRFLNHTYTAYDDEASDLESPCCKLIDQLNAIDFRVRVRAKWGFSDGLYTGMLSEWEKVKWRNVTKRYKDEMISGDAEMDDWEYIGMALPWDQMGDEERVRWRDTAQRYWNGKDGYSYLDIWTPQATEAYEAVMAQATNQYEV
ncbi:MAG: hypothetical protein Q9169_005900 [Polycauliona sp. 2 TL-2023]